MQSAAYARPPGLWPREVGVNTRHLIDEELESCMVVEKLVQDRWTVM